MNSLSSSGTYQHFSWEIRNFFSLPSEPNYYVQSAEFRFAGEPYCLRLYPRGTPNDTDCSVYVAIVLVRLPTILPKKKLWYEIGYISNTGGEFALTRYLCLVESVGRIEFYEKRSQFETRRETYVPNGILTLYCRIRLNEVTLASLQGEETRLEKLQSDYKRLLLKGTESDACLVVCGKEFPAHKCVLSARSPVFESMFQHDTAEKKSGRIVIDDLIPDHFQDFLEYLYTGRVESFSDDNAFALYAAADKYDVPTLKSECVEYARISLTVENFCDVITVALRHDEKNLFELAVEFFKKNAAKIIVTVKWQQFMNENSTRANELFIKLLVPQRQLDGKR